MSSTCEPAKNQSRSESHIITSSYTSGCISVFPATLAPTPLQQWQATCAYNCCSWLSRPHWHLSINGPTVVLLFVTLAMFLKFLASLGHCDPITSPWNKWFNHLVQPKPGATVEPLFLVETGGTDSKLGTSTPTSPGTTLGQKKRYMPFHSKWVLFMKPSVVAVLSYLWILNTLDSALLQTFFLSLVHGQVFISLSHLSVWGRATKVEFSAV